MSNYNLAYKTALKHTNIYNARAIAARYGNKPNIHKSLNLQVQDSVFIKKADDGNTYIEGKLTDIMPDTEGWSPTPEFAKKITDQINNNIINAFLTHKSYDDFIMRFGHLPKEAFIKKAREERSGLLENLKAIYENGVVWIKGLIKNEFVDKIKNIAKMSIELVVPPENQVNGKYTDGDVIGIALDNNAKNRRASFVLKTA